LQMPFIGNGIDSGCSVYEVGDLLAKHVSVVYGKK
jgi:hypothetical protein